jgi:hypothetical protein
MVVSLFVWPAVGSLLTVFASATVSLVDSVPKTSIRGSLKLLSLRSAFLLSLALGRCEITTNFLVDKLNVENYLPPLAKQVTETFKVVVNFLPIDLQLANMERENALWLWESCSDPKPPKPNLTIKEWKEGYIVGISKAMERARVHFTSGRVKVAERESCSDPKPPKPNLHPIIYGESK